MSDPHRDPAGDEPAGADPAGDKPATDRPPAVRLEATIRGRVQGVGFRYFVVRRATELGLVGWVANTPDGSVRCVAEGPVDAIDSLEAALGDGPLGAIVDGVDSVRMACTGRFDRFAVRSGAHSGD